MAGSEGELWERGREGGRLERGRKRVREACGWEAGSEVDKLACPGHRP